MAGKRRFKTLNFNIDLIIFIGGQFERFIKKILIIVKDHHHMSGIQLRCRISLT